jgi:hypothetical protein
MSCAAALERAASQKMAVVRKTRIDSRWIERGGDGRCPAAPSR